MRNVTIEMASEIQRPIAMERSPSTSTATPARMGSHTMTEVRPRPSIAALSALNPQQDPAEEHGEADDHPEGVGVQITALHAPQSKADALDHGGAAVHERAVDHGFVSAVPQAATEHAACSGQHVLVEPVEAVFVVENAFDRRELSRRAFGELGLLQEEEPGGEHACCRK